MRILHEVIQHNFTISKRYEEGWFNHWHQSIEVVYILEGLSKIQIGDTSRICKAGDVVVFNSGEIHSISDVETSVMYISTFKFDLFRNFCSEWKYIHNYISGEMLKEAGIADEIHNLFEEIYEESKGEKTWSSTLICANILRMYTLLVRHFERANSEHLPNMIKVNYFQEALQYIEEHYAENISLPDVAKIINYNPNYVSSMFVVYTGQNFKRYLDSFRIGKAVELIEQTADTFADIAARCGFANIRTFNNIFRKVTGITPSEYRQRNGKC